MIKVLIVDDSRLIRDIMEEILSSDPAIEVVGTAIDPYDAREKIKKLNPDVITLDIEMPKMDGISFLKKIMTLRPMPVVMFSSHTQKGADATIKALEIGAVDYVGKPNVQNKESLNALKNEIISKIKMASKAKVRDFQKNKADENNRLKIGANVKTQLIAIGSSTGGVEAIREVLVKLPEDTPPIVIVQHMPAKFTESFAKRMDSLCAMKVHEAKDGQNIIKGNVYIAPGELHMEIEKSGAGLVCRIKKGEKVSGHCPSVDVMFKSVARLGLKKVIGVMLTGMGQDGAKGMLEMKKSGSFNLGQSEQSCVVYGMPKVAKEIGAIDKEVTIEKMSEAIIEIY